MADPNEQDTPSPETDAAPSGLLGRVRGWVGGDRRRSLIVGGLFGLATLSTVVAWVVVANMTAAPPPVTIEQALLALDDGEDDLANSIVSEIQQKEELSPEEFSGAFFTLGVLKSREADRHWSPDRARKDYLIASKYLAEGRVFGFPEGRAAEGLFLLGKSLIESRQLAEGIQILKDALLAGAQNRTRAHLMLAEAHFFAPRPDYEETIKRVDLAVYDVELDPARRAEANLLRAEALAALGRGEEAMQSARQAQADSEPGRQALVEAKALVAQLETAPLSQRPSLAEAARAALETAYEADKLRTTTARQSTYLKARVAELLGEKTKALAEYDRLWRSSGDSPAGVAAAFAQGGVLQDSGESDAAVEAYRRAMDAIEDPGSYRSALAPLSDIRTRIRKAHERFLEEGSYPQALALVDRSGRLLGRAEQLALRAETLKQWGEKELASLSERELTNSPKLAMGRARLREAGLTYERLAEARYGSEQFDDDLWTAAETLRDGQSYAGAIRVLQRYLRNEPIRRNALALLRLGEAHLARGEDEQAIAAFDECLLFHEADAASFAARIGSAIAHEAQGDIDEAERLLRYNLTRASLSPDSPEWRDSKFALGKLLAEAERHDQAIRELDDAIELYPQDPRSLMARYHIGVAHRAAAQEPIERYRLANTVSERENARDEAETHLQAALVQFQEVIRELITSGDSDALSRATLRNCYMLSGDVYFELGEYGEARESYSRISTLHQNEPFMLEAFVHIYHCWRRQGDRAKSLGVVQQARLTLERLPQDSDFATSTNLTREEWVILLDQLAAI